MLDFTKPSRLNDLQDLINLFKVLEAEQVLEGLGFDMNREYRHRALTEHECGSACCIGGWVQYLNEDTRVLEIEDALGTIAPNVARDQLYEICWPSSTPNYQDITLADAIQVLEILRDTGKCDWGSVLNE